MNLISGLCVRVCVHSCLLLLTATSAPVLGLLLFVLFGYGADVLLFAFQYAHDFDLDTKCPKTYLENESCIQAQYSGTARMSLKFGLGSVSQKLRKKTACTVTLVSLNFDEI